MAIPWIIRVLVVSLLILLCMYGSHNIINYASDIDAPANFHGRLLNHQDEKSFPGYPTTLSNRSKLFDCFDRDSRRRIVQRGAFWVFQNYIQASLSFGCDESITYTTHGDFTFLDNLEPLLSRWQGPISLALYAPGTDFLQTIKAIGYLRKCGSPTIVELVTFHIYFENGHTPKEANYVKDLEINVNCKEDPPWVNIELSSLYKNKNKLLYPVNVGRNIARESATTHFILPSDIELYPNRGLLQDFLQMVGRKPTDFLSGKPKIFPIAIFEVKRGAEIPDNKAQLVEMLRKRTAISFHKKICATCHRVPKAKEWLFAQPTEGLHIFHVGKRMGDFAHWEPIFIGTHGDPLYDERLSWEGRSDKMTQGYAFCVLDYEFHILDNAFLVHRPGIKIFRKNASRDAITNATNVILKKEIVPQLKILYGEKEGCKL